MEPSPFTLLWPLVMKGTGERWLRVAQFLGAGSCWQVWAVSAMGAPVYMGEWGAEWRQGQDPHGSGTWLSVVPEVSTDAWVCLWPYLEQREMGHLWGWDSGPRICPFSISLPCQDHRGKAVLGSLVGWESMGLSYLTAPPQSLGGSMRLRSHPGMGSYRAKESGGSLEAGFLRETQGLEPGCALPVRLRSQMHRLSWEGHLCCWLN